MSQKTYKAEAKKVLGEILKKDLKPKFKAEYVGLQYNQKGGFYTMLVDIDVQIKTANGDFNTAKTIQIPVNLISDVNITVEAAKKEKKADKKNGKKADKKAEKKTEKVAEKVADDVEKFL